MKGLLPIAAAILLIGTVVGCTKKPTIVSNVDEPIDDPVDGGVTDYGNPNAPKEISSKNITGFYTIFFIHNRYNTDESGTMEIRIECNEDHNHILTVNGMYNHEMTVGDEVLEDVQKIIDKYELVKMNGEGKITAGLPSECGPWELTVDYDSGEQLHFYENGEPYADWTAEFRDYFVGVMQNEGFEDVYPAEEDVTIETFHIAFDVQGDKARYRFRNMDDGEIRLMRITNDATDYAEVSEELYTGLQEIIEGNRYDTLEVPVSYVKDADKPQDISFKISVHYVSGRLFNYDFKTWQLDPQWAEVRTVLTEYLDRYMENHPLENEE